MTDVDPSVTDDVDPDYARGYALVTAPEGLADALVEKAADLTRSSALSTPDEHVRALWALFGEDQHVRDGWVLDPERRVWTVPARDDFPTAPPEPDAVVRGKGRPAGGRPAPVPVHSIRPGLRVGADAQVSVAPRSAPPPSVPVSSLSDRQLAREMKVAEMWVQWARDPEAWRQRWDHRTMWIGRAAAATWSLPG